MQIFASGSLRDALLHRLADVREAVHSEPEDQLLNVDETAFIAYLAEKFSVSPLVFDFEHVTASDRVAMIPADRFPYQQFHVMRGERYPKQVITYHIPVSGDPNLLPLRPSRYRDVAIEATCSPDEVAFDVVNFFDDASRVKHDGDSTLADLKRQVENVRVEAEEFNRSLPESIHELVAARKQDILKRRGVLAALGVPVKKRDDVPSTFSVPIKRKAILVKPQAPTATFKPEPVLDEEVYDQILSVLHDFGVNMERTPSIYEGKDEEALRDLLLMQLAPHFQSVTGETFNRAGKTDILIRHEGGNVFVAECKIWRGPKNHLDAISQALGNLTWRDSKAALICFVQNVKLQPVLDSVTASTKSHAAFAAERPPTKQGWLNYNFHLLNDSSRRVRLAILCFHLPKEADAQLETGV